MSPVVAPRTGANARPTAIRPADPRGNTRSRSTTCTALLVVLLVALLTGGLVGCTRVRTALAVQADDTVSGEVVLATLNGPPPLISLPPALVGRVSVLPYSEEDYEGSRLQFGGLRFDELNSLATVVPATKGKFQFNLRRVGNRVLLNGQTDLTSVPADRTDVQLKIAVVGDLVSTDGKQDGSTISWTFPPGVVSEFSATVTSPDPAAPSVTRWALLVGAVVTAAAVGAVMLAKAHRNPPVRRTGRGP